MALPQKYTDEYLKKSFIEKSIQIGKTPSSKEYEHSQVLANRFGDGSYTKAIINLGFKPRRDRIDFRGLEQRSKSLTATLSCIKIFEMVLNKELKEFPKFFWKEITEQQLMELLKYFFEKKLNWTIEDIKNNLNTYFFAEYKLRGMFQLWFGSSPYKVVNFVYPNQIQEWEMEHTKTNYWTLEKCITVTKYLLEKEKWTIEDIKKKSIYTLFINNKVTTIYVKFFKNKSFDVINAIYPGKFLEWELLQVPKNYWNIETGTKAVKWLIEEILKWNEDDIKNKYNHDILKKHRLTTMIKNSFNGDIIDAINAAYPNKFKISDFNNISKIQKNRLKAEGRN
jgi:hypothetical protein